VTLRLDHEVLDQKRLAGDSVDLLAATLFLDARYLWSELSFTIRQQKVTSPEELMLRS
jgi:hypothetical protein